MRGLWLQTGCEREGVGKVFSFGKSVKRKYVKKGVLKCMRIIFVATQNKLLGKVSNSRVAFWLNLLYMYIYICCEMSYNSSFFEVP